MKLETPHLILVIVVILLAAGSLLAYPLNPSDFDAKAHSDGSVITVDMHSSMESDYVICAVNLNSPVEREVLLYLDDSYASPAGHDDDLSQKKELEAQLKYVGVKFRTIDAEGLKEVLSDTASASKRSVVFFSGALPCNVYAFNGEIFTLDLLKPWMESGGIAYWYAYERFGYYSAPLEKDFNGWSGQPLHLSFSEFGLSFRDTREDADDRSDISSLLGITQNQVESRAPVASLNVTNLGYLSDDGRCSMGFAKYGSGGILINGGEWTKDMSFAKIIASQVCDWTSLDPACSVGSFKGDRQITFDTAADAVYVYFGTITPRYADLFLLG
ncbi:hypothetical protein TALC_00074 [Thermoplasmatales archaeon BRNA1]|nr:hypothetical protein TALC_00074 [Thermoplasmatales archaeon BRNA1]